MATLKIKSDPKKISVEVDGVELVGLGISRIETKIESMERPTAEMAFDFCSHDVDIDGCDVVVDEIRLPVSVSAAIVEKVISHLGKVIDGSIKKLLADLYETKRGEEAIKEWAMAKGVADGVGHAIENAIADFKEEVSKGATI